jgi:hypothetical protein
MERVPELMTSLVPEPRPIVLPEFMVNVPVLVNDPEKPDGPENVMVSPENRRSRPLFVRVPELVMVPVLDMVPEFKRETPELIVSVWPRFIVSVTPDCTTTLVRAVVLVARVQLVPIIQLPVAGGGLHGLVIT